MARGLTSSLQSGTPIGRKHSWELVICEQIYGMLSGLKREPEVAWRHKLWAKLYLSRIAGVGEKVGELLQKVTVRAEQNGHLQHWRDESHQDQRY